jgi:glutathione S-transferase
MRLGLYAAVPDSVPVIRCSPPSWAAQIALLEEETHHDIHWLRFDRGEHRSPAMLERSPAGTVPVLLDGELVLTDTMAILDHIVATSSSKRLAVPGADSARSAARSGDALSVKDAGMQAFRHLMQGARGGDIWQPLGAALDRWEERFDRGAIAELDVATLIVFVYTETARSLGLSTEPWPALEAFTAQTRSRPSVAATWPPTWNVCAPPLS